MNNLPSLNTSSDDKYIANPIQRGKLERDFVEKARQARRLRRIAKLEEERDVYQRLIDASTKSSNSEMSASNDESKSDERDDK